MADEIEYAHLGLIEAQKQGLMLVCPRCGVPREITDIRYEPAYDEDGEHYEGEVWWICYHPVEVKLLSKTIKIPSHPVFVNEKRDWWPLLYAMGEGVSMKQLNEPLFTVEL